MTSVSKLKDRARDFERKEDWQKAIAAYLQVIEKTEAGDSDAELSLYNRVGDLYLRIGDNPSAVDYYEKAAQRYGETGLYNSAIALCNKALRYEPERVGLYRQLGALSAEQGFVTDARRWYLEYAERLMRIGKGDEAYTALDEFAGLSDDPEVREILASQLEGRGETERAVKQLRLAYSLRTAAGQSGKAEELKQRLLELDPELDPNELGLEVESTGSGGEPASHGGGALPGLYIESSAAGAGISEDEEAAGTPAELDGQPEMSEALETEAPGLETLEDDLAATEDETAAEIPGLMSTDLGADAAEELEDTGEAPAVEDIEVRQEVGLDEEFEVEDFAVAEGGTAGGVSDELDVEEGGADEVESEEVEPLPGFEDFEGFGADEETLGAAEEAEPLPGFEAFEEETGDVAQPETAEHEADLSAIELEEDVEADEAEPEPLPGFEAAEDEAAEVQAEAEPLAGFEPAEEVEEEAEELPGFDEAPQAAADEQAPAVEEEMAAVEEEPAPVEEKAPAVEEEAPALEEQAPVLEEKAPAVEEEMAPVEEEPAPVEEQAPAIEEEAPAVEEAEEAEEAPLLAEEAPIAAEEEAPSPPAEAPVPQPETAPATEFAGAIEAAAARYHAGEQDEALGELERMHAALADEGRLREAYATAEAMIALDPDLLRAHQHRVEYAFRLQDRSMLVDAYLDFGGSLQRGGQDSKSRSVFQRVLEIEPENAAAKAALARPDTAAAGEEFVDLGSMLRDESEPTTRFKVAETHESGDEEQDFADMLAQFRAKVAEHVSEEDSDSHYDLGLAYKEMGLVDEAIAEFQIAMRAGSERLKMYEELGQCFMLKQQYNIAAKLLSRGAQLPARDETELLGVYYQLARCYEELGKTDEAREAYERVLGLDIAFRDADERMRSL